MGLSSALPAEPALRQSVLTKASLATLISESLFTLGRLHGDPETASLVATMQGPHDALKAGQLTQLTLADARAMGEGGVQAAMSGVHREFTALWLLVKTITGNGREAHPLMTQLFPRGLTGAKAVASTDIAAEVKRLIGAIKENHAQASLQDHLRPLAEVEKRLEKPLLAMAENRAAGAARAGPNRPRPRRLPERARRALRHADHPLPAAGRLLQQLLPQGRRADAQQEEEGRWRHRSGRDHDPAQVATRPRSRAR